MKKKTPKAFINATAGLKFRIPIYNLQCSECGAEIDVEKCVGTRPQHKGGWVKLENKEKYKEPKKKQVKATTSEQNEIEEL
jgi:hypothetical protein